MEYQHIRKDYHNLPLSPADLMADPLQQVDHWIQHAIKLNVAEPHAMALATANKAAVPSCRVLLLQEIDERGLLFYTNYNSRKGHDLQENPRASMNFYWKELIRQVTIEGTVEKLPHEKSVAYFHSRPRKNQLAAWTSRQDAVIASREELEAAYARAEEQFVEQEVPMPDDWGGYRLVPEAFIFWQGRQNRLHDRFLYKRVEGEERWEMVRLSP